ncbi:MAG: GNAT family N-acetyltransferase [Gemmatimonadaceae bacterium]
MPLELQLLQPNDARVFDRVADGVFDCPVDPTLEREFLDDPRHHMYVAIADGVVVGMISAVHYVHPDKPAQLWINEVGVAPSHHRQGIGSRLLDAMLEHGRSLGCTEAWLGTEEDNVAARRLYLRVASSAAPFILYSFDLSAPVGVHDTSAA